MDKNNKYIKLYDVIFPIWLLWVLPQAWLVVFPANLLINFLVLVLAMKIIKIQNIWQKIKPIILKITAFGLLADLIGTAIIISTQYRINYQTNIPKWWYNNIVGPICYNPFSNIYAFMFMLVCVSFSAFFIYLFDYKYCLKSPVLTTNREKSSLCRSPCLPHHIFSFFRLICFSKNKYI